MAVFYLDDGEKKSTSTDGAAPIKSGESQDGFKHIYFWYVMKREGGYMNIKNIFLTAFFVLFLVGDAYAWKFADTITDNKVFAQVEVYIEQNVSKTYTINRRTKVMIWEEEEAPHPGALWSVAVVIGTPSRVRSGNFSLRYNKSTRLPEVIHVRWSK